MCVCVCVWECVLVCGVETAPAFDSSLKQDKVLFISITISPTVIFASFFFSDFFIIVFPVNAFLCHVICGKKKKN